jgi:hypothetical protein
LADRSYVSQALATELRETWGIEFFAEPRRNMKNHLLRLNDKLLARKRAIVETVIDQLKNIRLVVKYCSARIFNRSLLPRSVKPPSGKSSRALPQ